MVDRLVVDLGEDGQAVVLAWPDGGLPEEVARAPLIWPLDGGALEDLRWYLEDYLTAPFGVWEERGPAVKGKLAGWGDQIFSSVFGVGPARDAYQRARDRGLEVLIRSAEPGLLGLPWELMRDDSGPMALGKGGISRSLPVAGGAGTLEVPGGRLRVLMVISRPAGTRDVGYQMVARPLLKRLEAVRGEVGLTVLRPPTFDMLANVVKAAADAGAPFHVVHFDGHGVMPGRAAGSVIGGRPAMMSGPGEGVLTFEKPRGGTDHVGASKVAAALADGLVPVVVLNACQSGAVGKELEASIATALLKSGCAAVIAMAYSVYAVAAAEFMAAFYESLFAGDSLGQAVIAGRKRLFSHDGRPSLKGDMPLADWLVPVHYMRREVRFPVARASRPAAAPSLDAALDEIRAAPAGDTVPQDLLAAVGAFVGRDDLFYQLETAARLQRLVVLTGPGGTGKTELAKGFARWWRSTGGVDDPRLVLWHSFEPGVASFGLDRVITEIGLAVFGTDFSRLHGPQRLESVKRLLGQHRALLVWDNFESVREMPDPTTATPPLDKDGCTQLRDFLQWVRDHSASTVLITSRAQEAWLGNVRQIPVGGLNRTEAAQYAAYLLEPFPAARQRRERRSFGELLDWLDGHPLAMRLTLPRLETDDPSALLAGLRATSPPPADDDPGEGRLSSLATCITYSFAHLPERTRRLLPAISLLYGIADKELLTLFSGEEGVPGRFAGISRDEWSTVLEDAARVGLLTGIRLGVYRIHPALPGYLAAEWRAEDPDRYGPERTACEEALRGACAELGQWLMEQIGSGDVVLAYTLLGLHRRTLTAMLGHALDYQAWNHADYIARALSDYWETQGLSGETAAWTDRILAVTADQGQVPRNARSLWLNTIFRRADQQRKAGQPDVAAQDYQQALTWLQVQPEDEWARGSIGITYLNLGNTAVSGEELDEADDWYRKSLTVLEDLGDRLNMALTYLGLGNTAYRRGRFDAAEDWYRQSLTILEDLGDRPHMRSTYHGLGNTAWARGRRDEAEDWYHKSLTISESLSDRLHMAGTYYQLGTMAEDRVRLDEAEDWYHKSLTISEGLGDRPGIARTYNSLGYIAYLFGRRDEAEDWYRKSLTIEEELRDRPGMVTSCTALGIIAEDRGQVHEALAWCIRCVTLSREFLSPLTRTGSPALAAFADQLGMPVLELAWLQVTGQPVPPQIRDYITSRQDNASPPGAPMTDPIADAARSAVVSLDPDLVGTRLLVQVEAALAARQSQEHPDRYLDPVSLASLIVSIATLAWGIYNDQRTRDDQRRHTPEPHPDIIARQVRITLRDADIQLPPGTEHITEIIATEITRHASPSQWPNSG